MFVVTEGLGVGVFLVEIKQRSASAVQHAIIGRADRAIRTVVLHWLPAVKAPRSAYQHYSAIVCVGLAFEYV